jgi:asparagine synthase (glutamine-hydrolysing)
MCGITGYWGYARADLARDAFEAFTHSLAHRGPDGFGIEHWPDAHLWLGHRRLAVIDLSDHARQPLSYGNGRYWITYNGEVYNYSELRQELTDLGHRFVSHGDTEVVVAAYAQWGAECQLRFNGMWAFAIWDAREQQLFISRDRFGVKPLHYSLHNGAIAFASELKALLTLPWIDGGFDVEILSETLNNIAGQASSIYTLLKEVRQLQAGHTMLVNRDGRVRIARWWNTLDHLPTIGTDLQQHADEFRQLFFDSCRVRLRSDVPLATSLSGGIDSSAVACTISELGRVGKASLAPRDWQRAFVACFTNTPNDEQNYARAIVQHTGMTAHYEKVDEATAVRHIERAIFDIEGIFGHPAVGTWMIYRAMRANGMRVSLDGQGADELLGGYDHFVETALDAAMMNFFNFSRYSDLKVVLRGITGDDVGRAGNLRDIKWLLKRISRNGKRLLRHKVNRVSLLKHHWSGSSVCPWSGGSAVHASIRGGQSPLRLYLGPRRLYYAEADRRICGMTPLQAALFSSFHGSMLPTLLRQFDRVSMAHGIETRMPFMDWRLVTYSFSLPDTSKIGGGVTKRVLRMAMQGLVPDAIRLRTNKIGFVSPISAWTRGTLNTWLRDLCASRSFLDSEVWSGEAVRMVLEQAIARQTGIDPVWPIIHAHVLEQAFKAQARQYRSSPSLASSVQIRQTYKQRAV